MTSPERKVNLKIVSQRRGIEDLNTLATCDTHDLCYPWHCLANGLRSCGEVVSASALAVHLANHELAENLHHPQLIMSAIF